MTNYKTHKHYELAYRAHSGTSFSPDKRAEAYCNDFDNQIKELEALEGMLNPMLTKDNFAIAEKAIARAKGQL